MSYLRTSWGSCRRAGRLAAAARVRTRRITETAAVPWGGASLYPQSWTRACADLGGVCNPCRSFCLSSLAHVSDLTNPRSSASMRKPRDRERERNESKDGPRVTRHRGLSRAPLFQPRRMPARAHGAAERGVRGRRDRGPRSVWPTAGVRKEPPAPRSDVVKGPLLSSAECIRNCL